MMTPPLPLIELRQRISQTTFQWLQDADDKEAERRKADAEEQDAGEFLDHSIAMLFRQSQVKVGDELEQEEEEEEEDYRVQTWCSSLSRPDGIGGYTDTDTETNSNSEGHSHLHSHSEEAVQKSETEIEIETGNGIRNGGEGEDVHSHLHNQNEVLTIKYILSDAGGGHGDDLWAASRHISNIFADPNKCRDILNVSHRGGGSGGGGDGKTETRTRTRNQDECLDQHKKNHNHPLLGLRVVELGAGAGLPSWTAMQCGARVVCTDQAIPNRIRCIAECAELNIRVMKDDYKYAPDDVRLVHAEMARGAPYDWGTPIDDIVTLGLDCDGNGNDDDDKNRNNCKDNLFDIVVAADCIYMPHFHSLLLDSIKLLLSKDGGVALLPFALHGNTKDENVWGIVDLAEEKGFKADTSFQSQQLIPQSDGMDNKRALVHTIRLTWR